MEQILLQGISLQEFKDLITETVAEKFKVSSVQSNVQSNPRFLSRVEVAQLLNVSLPTLNEWTKLGYVQSYRIGNRVFYKTEEIEQSLIKVKNLKYKRG